MGDTEITAAENNAQLQLGRIIEKKRKEKGMTRTALAKFTGISPNSMVKYEKAGEETGKYPSLENMAKIAEVLEFDPRKIFECVAFSEEIKRSEDFSFIHTFKDLHNEHSIDYSVTELHAIGHDMRKVFDILADLKQEIADLKSNQK